MSQSTNLRSTRCVLRTISSIGVLASLVCARVVFAQEDDVDSELEALEQSAQEPEPSSEAEPAGGAPAQSETPSETPAAEPPAPETRAEQESEELDEVVVTVDRRKKSLQEYSGTAMAFSEKKLASVGVQNVRDLASMVPGLQIGNQEGNTEVFIRGVGSDNNTELGDPAVAIHLDGVYLPRPRGMGAMFYDIARVEVNSGPQGTLRGRNAVGGTVNIVANQPQLGEYAANAEATFGTFSQRRYQGMLNVPLGSTFALRVAGFSEVHDPHWENAGPIHDIEGPESIDSYSYRGQMKWQPTLPLTILASYDYTAERGTGWLGANFQGPLTQNDDNGTPDDTTDDVAVPFEPEDIDNPRRIYNRGQQSSVDLKHYGAKLEINYDAGPVIVSAMGSYRDMHFLQNNGGNAGVIYDDYGFANDTPDNFGNAYWDQASQSIVSELRLQAPDDARLRWSLGGFLFDETQQTFLGQTSDPAGGFGGGEFPMPETRGKSYAAYADATFDVNEDLRLIAGLRFTSEHKSRYGGMWSLWTGFPNLPNGDSPRFGTEGFQYHGVDRTILELPENPTAEDRVALFLDGIKSFGARDEVAQALCADPPAAPEGEDPLSRLEERPDAPGHFQCAYGIHPQLGEDGFQLQAIPQDNEVNDTFFDWRAGLEYDLAKDNLLYATVSTGHKVGGFNDTAPGDGTALFNSDYDTEQVIAYELGSKNLLMERKLRLNASAFYYQYQDQVFQQVIAVVEDPDPETPGGGSNTAVRQNAASSAIYGLDVDAVLRLPAGLEAELHALVMDARFGDDVIVNDGRIGFDVPIYPVNIGGNWLPRVSRLTLNYALSQELFTTAGVFNWIINGQTRTTHYMTPFNGEGELLPRVDGQDTNTASYQALLINPQRLTDVVPTYTRFDAGAGWRHPDGRISVSAFVNNVFNVAYTTSIISTPGLNLRFFNAPRTAGVRFRVDW